MRFLPTKVHGALDYLVGILLIAAPWLFGFAHGGLETWLPVILGASALIYSLCTAYEAGAFKLIPMSVHLWIDILSGALLAASPWLFGFNDRVYIPHLAFGIFEMMAAIITRTRPHDANTEKYVQRHYQKQARGRHNPAHN